MKVLNVVLGILFVAATAQAQIPVYPYLYSQYYGAVPTVGSPAPFSWLDQYTNYYANQAQVGDMTQEVNQLRNQVSQLQTEVGTAQAQIAQMRAPVVLSTVQPVPVVLGAPLSAVATPQRAEKPVLLVFGDGSCMVSSGYAVSGDTLWYLTPSGIHRLPLSSLNLTAAQVETLKRGSDVLALPSGNIACATPCPAPCP
jgi:hypothetical protein